MMVSSETLPRRAPTRPALSTDRGGLAVSSASSWITFSSAVFPSSGRVGEQLPHLLDFLRGGLVLFLFVQRLGCHGCLSCYVPRLSGNADLKELHTSAGFRFGLVDGCLMKARMSALIVSACVVGMPWGKPL